MQSNIGHEAIRRHGDATIKCHACCARNHRSTDTVKPKTKK